MTPFYVDLTPITGGPGESIVVRDDVELDTFDKGGERVRPAGSARIDLVVENVGERAFVVRGSVAAELELGCGRCLKLYVRATSADVDALFKERPAPDDEAYPVTGHRIDIAPALVESLVLEVPFAPVCCEACEGLCPVCGADLSKGSCGCVVEDTDPRLAGLGEWVRDRPGSGS